MTATFQSWATARSTTPNAALDLPLPSPVFTRTSDRADVQPLRERVLGGRLLRHGAVTVSCEP